VLIFVLQSWRQSQLFCSLSAHVVTVSAGNFTVRGTVSAQRTFMDYDIQFCSTFY